MVKADWCVHVKVISKGPGVSYGSVYGIVHDSLGYRKVSCRWVPKLLDNLNKAKRMMSLQHLQHYSEEGERFLDLTAIGDETWVFHFTPESKEQSMVWKHPSSRLMVTVIWNHRGPLLLDFMPRGATINADSYCGTLACLQAAIRKKVPGDSRGRCGSPP
ncbi:uncharacterized protein LOC111873039 [Cryptotermes secundus]|uniref:uncharacterized protein LOC111873039 n=1 Tax=Cryptotermes secundus TaxID=105785 RepID=UPI000CD7D3CB|nr:uncharacterized protein LOC111873039 [Cryptotermes secundus]